VEVHDLAWTYDAIRLTEPGDPDWRFKEDLWIYRPGATESEQLPVSDTGNKKVSGPDLLEVLNELGAEGWELITETTRESTIGKRRGWPDSGHPIVRQWTLKRPAAQSGAEVTPRGRYGNSLGASAPTFHSPSSLTIGTK
jgi:hypothetical protein